MAPTSREQWTSRVRSRQLPRHRQGTAGRQEGEVHPLILKVDGSFGEGGGQILRTALALSLITGRAFQISNIRQSRAKPGLRPQHLAAVRAAARIGSGHVEGDRAGSSELIFRPGRVEGGEYEFDVGTAGSTTLVFQTVLPALLLCRRASAVTFVGGTHNHGGPPWDFIQSVFLPAIRRMGAAVTVERELPVSVRDSN